MLSIAQARSALRDKWLLFLMSLAAAVFGLMVGLIFWKARPLGLVNESFVLHYNIFFGVDKLGSWQGIFWLPAIGLVALLINILIALITHAHERAASYVLIAGAFVANVTLFIATLFIVLANI